MQTHMHVPDSYCLVPSQILSGHEGRKTLMIMNIPIRLQIHDLAYLVKHSIGESRYDCIRLPQDDGMSGCNKGYAFVNCTSSEAVLYFWMKWHRRSWHDICPNSQKKCQISFAHNQLPARLQNTQHHVEEDSERIKNVGTVRARGTDGAQKGSRRAHRMICIIWAGGDFYNL